MRATKTDIFNNYPVDSDGCLNTKVLQPFASAFPVPLGQESNSANFYGGEDTRKGLRLYAALSAGGKARVYLCTHDVHVHVYPSMLLVKCDVNCFLRHRTRKVKDVNSQSLSDRSSLFLQRHLATSIHTKILIPSYSRKRRTTTNATETDYLLLDVQPHHGISRAFRTGARH